MQEVIRSVPIVYKASGPDPGEEKERVSMMFVQGYLAKQWLSQLRQPAPSARTVLGLVYPHLDVSPEVLPYSTH